MDSTGEYQRACRTERVRNAPDSVLFVHQRRQRIRSVCRSNPDVVVRPSARSAPGNYDALAMGGPQLRHVHRGDESDDQRNRARRWPAGEGLRGSGHGRVRRQRGDDAARRALDPRGRYLLPIGVVHGSGATVPGRRGLSTRIWVYGGGKPVVYLRCGEMLAARQRRRHERAHALERRGRGVLDEGRIAARVDHRIRNSHRSAGVVVHRGFDHGRHRGTLRNVVDDRGNVADLR